MNFKFACLYVAAIVLGAVVITNPPRAWMSDWALNDQYVGQYAAVFGVNPQTGNIPCWCPPFTHPWECICGGDKPPLREWERETVRLWMIAQYQDGA